MALAVDQARPVQFVTDGREYLHRVLSCLRNAREEILLETYIFRADDVGEVVLAELEAAVRRGVHVRCIVDWVGSRELVEQQADRLRRSGVDWRVFHPPPWPISRLGVKRVGRLIMRLNQRDHRKLLVVDGRWMVLGSRNVWQESLEWCEANVFVEHGEIAEAISSFDYVWGRSTSLDGRWHDGGLRGQWRFTRARHVLTNYSRRRRKRHRGLLYDAIRKSTRRVWIATPYLNPHASFMRLLKAKARAGVDVCILLSKTSDIAVSKWLSEAVYLELLRGQIRIFEYGDRLLHAKVLTVDDDLVVVGSSNFNLRSFRQDLEVDYYSPEPDLIAAVSAWQQKMMDTAEHITSISDVRYALSKRLVRFLMTPLKSSF